MAYKTIFNIKPNSENKKGFCQRIVKLLGEFKLLADRSIYTGKEMLDIVFMYSKFNNGFSGVDDLLNEADKSYSNIFYLSRCDNESIILENVLANIDIIINCMSNFNTTKERHFCEGNNIKETLEIMARAIKEFLLCNGYKLEFDKAKNQVFIVSNDIPVNVDEIKDAGIRTDVINYYDYKTAKDMDEKKKIIVNLASKLESRKDEISAVLGDKIADMFGNYANNFNLRHNNSVEKFKSKYKEQIGLLSNEELLNWWNYIFAFMLNIYMNLDKVKNVNINSGFKNQENKQ